MDEEDYSWVRRTKFSHSVVRSSSGREQFGAFVEQFNRGGGAALKQKGFNSELKIPAHNLQPRAKGAVSNSAGPSIPRAKSAVSQAERKPKDVFSDGQLKQRGEISDCSLQETSVKQDSKAGPKGNGLSLDTPHRHVIQTLKDENSDMPEFSFHSEEQSLRLQRVCSSPAPFFSKDATPASASTVRSASVKVMGDGSKPKRRAKSPVPTRVISDVFKEAKAATKRFSTPQRQRKSSSLRSLDDSPPFGFSSMRTPSKLKTRRASSWPRNFDNGVAAKVAALEILDVRDICIVCYSPLL